MRAYYNEFNPFAAQWLRNLIDAGLIAPGDVDQRSIVDVRPDDLRGYSQCHFFAGIGGWSRALRLAGWPDDRPVWTGSCPCQPFSGAGRRRGVADERHLWPEFFRLIRERGPVAVLGEQVASPDGLAWLDLVHADLEDAGYACGAVDLCAAGVGAPHIRQRLWWGAEPLADAVRPGRPERRSLAGYGQVAGRRGARGMGDTGLAGSQGRAGVPCGGDQRAARTAGLAGRLANAAQQQRNGGGSDRSGWGAQHSNDRAIGGVGADSGYLPDPSRPGPSDGFWRNADWLFCRDGRWRPVEPGTFPLADGVPGRVGLLRAYGNAIVPQVAAHFIRAWRDERG